MDLLGFELTAADLRAWLEAGWEYALPRLLVSLGLLLVAALLYRGIGWIMGWIERHVTDPTGSDLDDAILQGSRKVILLSIGFWAGWRLALAWDLELTARLVAAGWIVGLSFPLSRFTSDLLEVVEKRIAPRTGVPLDETALPLINKFARFLVVVLGALIAVDFLGIAITPVLAGAGVAGLAISLAAKDTLSNLIAGVLLILDRPFQVGDRIELWHTPGETGSWGDVVEIGLRATKIRNPDNVIMVIPNNEIMRRDIVNYTASGENIRIRVPLGISYDSDPKLAKRLTLEVAREVEGVLSEPEPAVIVRGFADSAVNLELRVWISEARQRRNIADEITGRVKEAFDREGIEIPFPKRDVYIKAYPGSPDSPVEIGPAGTSGDPPAEKPDDPPTETPADASAAERSGEEAGSEDR